MTISAYVKLGRSSVQKTVTSFVRCKKVWKKPWNIISLLQFSISPNATTPSPIRCVVLRWDKFRNSFPLAYPIWRLTSTQIDEKKLQNCSVYLLLAHKTTHHRHYQETYQAGIKQFQNLHSLLFARLSDQRLAASFGVNTSLQMAHR